MTVRITSDPSAVLPGEVVGRPIRLPSLLLCSMGGDHPCGWMRTANTERQFAEFAAERRKHERTCKGGLIVAGGR